MIELQNEFTENAAGLTTSGIAGRFAEASSVVGLDNAEPGVNLSGMNLG